MYGHVRKNNNMCDGKKNKNHNSSWYKETSFWMFICSCTSSEGSKSGTASNCKTDCMELRERCKQSVTRFSSPWELSVHTSLSTYLAFVSTYAQTMFIYMYIHIYIYIFIYKYIVLYVHRYIFIYMYNIYIFIFSDSCSWGSCRTPKNA